MSTSFENKATNRGVVTFTISQDKIKPALDQAFNKVKKDLTAQVSVKVICHVLFLIKNLEKRLFMKRL